MGRKGRKNCLVMGKIKDNINKVDIKVLTSGPGCSIIDKQNMPKIARMRYWPSQKDHLWALSERSVSDGSHDVWRVARLEPGDWPLLIRDPNFLRMRLKPGIEGHPIRFCLVNVVEWVSSIAGNSFDRGDFILIGHCEGSMEPSRRRVVIEASTGPGNRMSWCERYLTSGRSGLVRQGI